MTAQPTWRAPLGTGRHVLPPPSLPAPPVAAVVAGRRRLGDVLVSTGLLEADELREWLELQAEDPASPRLGVMLVEAGRLSAEQVARALAGAHGLPFIELTADDIDADAARLLPRSVAERLVAMPIRWREDRLMVAVSDPVDVLGLDDVRMLTAARALDVVVVTPRTMQERIGDVWAEQTDREALSRLVDELPESTRGLGRPDTSEDSADAATVRMVDRMLAHAARAGASDLHLEPQREGLQIRERVDGVMRDVMMLPAASQASLLARIKVMCGLDVIEKRLPQDGRVRVAVDGRTVDVRVSTMPSLRGDTTVMRLLPTAMDLPKLSALGLEPDQEAELRAATVGGQGMVLITGPTGSGKTNTLYATVRELVSRERNVITLEDPVEVELGGVTQVQIDEKNGFTFARGLRAALRQDPDVILVGEIRDYETAELAVRAALTGHLVLATLHTLDAASSVTRLVDMGVPAYLVAASARLVLAQRLLRRPCPACTTDVEIETSTAVLLGLAPGSTVAEGRGCQECGGSGHRGRIAIFESLVVDQAVRDAVVAGSDAEGLRVAAGSPPGLLERAALAAQDGRVSGREALRVAGSDETS